MGAFYGLIQFRTEDRDSVLEAVRKYTRRRTLPMLVSPVIRGWVGVYPAGNGQSEDISKGLAKLVGGDVLHLLVHDDDIFAYFFYRDGKVVDRFNSSPDYFEPVSSRARSLLRGRPERLAHLLPDAGRLDDLRDLLGTAASGRVTFASQHLERFAELFDIPNTMEAYEYLREQEGEGVERWDEFVHVPDLSEDRGRRLAADAEAARVTQRLRDEGALLYVESRPGTDKEFGCMPWFCPNAGDGFLVFWQDWRVGAPRPLEEYRPPWTAPQGSGIDLPPTTHCLSRSPSGRFLTVGHASGDWNVRVWDLSAGRVVREVRHERAVVWVGFSADEQFVASVGSQDCLIHRLDTGERVGALDIRDGKTGAMHPDGTFVVCTQSGRLHLIDVATGRETKALLVGDPSQIEGMRQMQRAVFSQMLRSWESPEARAREEMEIHRTANQPGMPDAAELRRQIEGMRASTIRQIEELQPGRLPTRGGEIPASLAFSGDGRYLAAGTSRGARVYDWQAVRAASDYMPAPVARFDSLTGPLGGESNFIYGVAWHASDTGIFFGGLDGRIDYLDVPTGQLRVLCELPGRADYLAALRSSCEPGAREVGGIAVLSMAVSLDGASLGCCLQPDFYSRDRVRKPYQFTVWDIRTLLGRSGPA